jgi:hypothetical protein
MTADVGGLLIFGAVGHFDATVTASGMRALASI